VTVNTTEGAAYGAALLAGVGAGVWADVDTACDQTIYTTGSTLPQAKSAARYERVYAQYGRLYPALTELFTGLSAV
jgi:xylulokinase